MKKNAFWLTYVLLSLSLKFFPGGGILEMFQYRSELSLGDWRVH
jgi:hypothetical protein